MQQRRAAGVGTSGASSSAAVVAGGLVFASAVTGTGDDGRLVGPDVQSQTRQTFVRLSTVLEAAGSSLAQTVALSVFLRRASDFDPMNSAYREAVGENPPTRTTVVADLAGGALVACSAVAVPAGAPREVLHPPGWARSPRPYSYIVRAGDLVFFSGLLSRRGRDDAVVPGPASLQTATILENAGTLLRTAGLSFDDVVAARVFLTDESLFDSMNDEYRKVFPVEPPARATAITGLMGAEAFVEISLIASSGGRTVIGYPVSPSVPISAAVRTGDLVFLSGILGNTDVNARDVAGQAREVLARIGRTLESAGLSHAHVVDNLVYLANLSDRAEVDGVYREFFPSDPPASTTIGTRLVARTGLVEMMMTAVG
jgi:2-iminobutanoate/2-iminopropanoate deaminase